MSAAERAYQRFVREQGPPTKATPESGSEFEDLFQVLGCTELATVSQLTAEYKHLVKRYHPDKQAGPEKDLATFQKIARAYEILTDSDKRKEYDRYWGAHLSLSFDAWLQLDQHHRVSHWEVGKRAPTLTFDQPKRVD